MAQPTQQISNVETIRGRIKKVCFDSFKLAGSRNPAVLARCSLTSLTSAETALSFRCVIAGLPFRLYFGERTPNPNRESAAKKRCRCSGRFPLDGKRVPLACQLTLCMKNLSAVTRMRVSMSEESDTVLITRMVYGIHSQNDHESFGRW